ncbi:mucin-2-like [Lytechinus pictus]|uniref:mucin-2-like n=1 Tax=Lytechinus pictus TaxID=7653 RepID=UPI0030BA2767
METPTNPVTDLALTSVTHGHATYTQSNLITTPSDSSTTLKDPSTAPSDSSTTLRYLISTLNEPITTSDYSSTESSTAPSDRSSHSGSQSDLSTKSHDSSTTQSDLNTPPSDLISTPHFVSTAPSDYLSTTIDFTNTPSHPSSTLIDADTTLFDYSFSLTSIITYTPTISSTTALSTSSTPSTKSQFSAISTVSNVTTAGPDPTTTKSDPTTAASPSSCSSIACNNGGTIDRDDCTCACTGGFQGDDCSTPQAEIRISIVILINVDMITWLQIQDILLDAIAQVTSDYCNTNFGQCCPNYGEKATSGRINFASANDVKIVSGYPIESNVGSGLATETAVYIEPTSMTSSCEEGSSRSAPDSDTMIYIPQDVVLAAINDNLDVIESQLGVSISNVTLGMVDDVQPEETSPGLNTAWIVGICLLTVIPLIMVAICLLALKMKIYQNQRWWQWHQRQVRSTRVEPIVQPLDQRFTWKQEIDGNPDIYILRNF